MINDFCPQCSTKYCALWRWVASRGQQIIKRPCSKPWLRNLSPQRRHNLQCRRPSMRFWLPHLALLVASRSDISHATRLAIYSGRQRNITDCSWLRRNSVVDLLLPRVILIFICVTRLRYKDVCIDALIVILLCTGRNRATCHRSV